MRYEWGHDIWKRLSKTPDFVGVFSIDKLPRKLPHDSCGGVINLDVSTGPGTHWVAFFKNKGGGAEYFDPLGDRPPRRIASFLNRHSPMGVAYNRVPYQSERSTLCGNFCIFYLERRLAGQSFCSITAVLSTNSPINDIIVS
jgi:hypothetical protein